MSEADHNPKNVREGLMKASLDKDAVSWLKRKHTHLRHRIINDIFYKHFKRVEVKDKKPNEKPEPNTNTKANANGSAKLLRKRLVFTDDSSDDSDNLDIYGLKSNRFVLRSTGEDTFMLILPDETIINVSINTRGCRAVQVADKMYDIEMSPMTIGKKVKRRLQSIETLDNARTRRSLLSQLYGELCRLHGKKQKYSYPQGTESGYLKEIKDLSVNDVEIHA
jgi:hypothetical protein